MADDHRYGGTERDREQLERLARDGRTATLGDVRDVVKEVTGQFQIKPLGGANMYRWLAGILAGLTVTVLSALAATWSASAEEKVKAVAEKAEEAKAETQKKLDKEAAKALYYPRPEGEVLRANQHNMIELLKEIKEELRDIRAEQRRVRRSTGGGR